MIKMQQLASIYHVYSSLQYHREQKGYTQHHIRQVKISVSVNPSEIFKTNTDKSSIRQTCKAQPLPRMHTNTEDRWAVENSPINIENICMFLSNYSYKEEASFFY